MQYESDSIPDLSEIGGYWDQRPVKWHHSGLDPGLVTYVAQVEHTFWPGRYEIQATGSSVYEGRNDGYAIRWIPEGQEWHEGRDNPIINGHDGTYIGRIEDIGDAESGENYIVVDLM